MVSSTPEIELATMPSSTSPASSPLFPATGYPHRFSTARRRSSIAERDIHAVESGGKWEGVDFDIQESTSWLQWRRKQTDWDVRKRAIFSWASTFFASLLTMCVAVAIDYVLICMETVKYDQILGPLTLPGKSQVNAIFTFWAINLVLVGIASLMCNAWAPAAAGSGIPEIKCALNGNRQPHALSLRTLVAKAIGVLFSVAGSLPVGKEGPMIHCGAIIGSGIGQGMSTTLNFRAAHNTQFRNDVDRRDQIAAGAATGVTAAFGAPIGGVLFAIEEGASYWNQQITWRTFFGTMCGALFLDVCLDAVYGERISTQGNYVVDKSYIVEFGTFGNLDRTQWVLLDLPFVIIMGVICGLVGALFNETQKRLSRQRMIYCPATHPVRRFFESLTISTFVSMCAVGIPLLLPQSVVCVPISSAETMQDDGALGLDVKLQGTLQQFFCPNGYYNTAATLFFSPSDKAILNLFHNGTRMNLGVLFLFGTVYFFLAMLTYGISVPSGLFVPCLTLGAAFGRFYGEVLHLWLPPLQNTNIAFYALLGAGGMLGGIARLTLCATVIILEATQNVSYTVPVMICTMVAKKVADQFNDGLYDVHIRLKNIPLLEETPPPHSEMVQVRDVLSRRLRSVYEITTAGEVQEVLLSTTHSSFPVTANSDGRYTGLITRNRLASLLALKAWTVEKPETITGRWFNMEPGSYIIPHTKLEHFYPRYPKIVKPILSAAEREYWMDLTPYMNPAAYTVSDSAPLSRCFRLFRGLGLRHVPVLDERHRPVGVITRKCLMEEAIEDALDRLAQKSMSMSLMKSPMRDSEAGGGEEMMSPAALMTTNGGGGGGHRKDADERGRGKEGMQEEEEEEEESEREDDGDATAHHHDSEHFPARSSDESGVEMTTLAVPLSPSEDANV